MAVTRQHTRREVTAVHKRSRRLWQPLEKNRRTGTVLIMVESGLEKDPQTLSSVTR